jgi:hypothetical protein
MRKLLSSFLKVVLFLCCSNDYPSFHYRMPKRKFVEEERARREPEEAKLNSRRLGSSKFVALLRGINVGGVRVDMKKLKDVFLQLSFISVVTVLQTGNVVFCDEGGRSCVTIQQQLESTLSNVFEYKAFVQVLNFTTFEKIISQNIP